MSTSKKRRHFRKDLASVATSDASRPSFQGRNEEFPILLEAFHKSASSLNPRPSLSLILVLKYTKDDF